MKKLCLCLLMCGILQFLSPQEEVLKVDFEGLSVGKYENDLWKGNWNHPKWQVGLEETVEIVPNGENGRSMRVTYPAGQYGVYGGGINGALWHAPLKDAYDSLYLTFRFKFNDEFEWVKGGKFHGLQWGQFTKAGVIPKGDEGGYFANMWREDGQLVCYMYHPNQQSIWGDDLVLRHKNDSVFKAQSDQWYTITNFIALNKVGENNGIVRTWIDGELLLNIDTLRFRDADTVKINYLNISTFFGGSDSTWAPNTDQYMWFDDFELFY